MEQGEINLRASNQYGSTHLCDPWSLAFHVDGDKAQGDETFIVCPRRPRKIVSNTVTS